MVSVKVLRFFSSHRATEKGKILSCFTFLFFFFPVKKAPLLPQKRKAARLWLLQAFPKKSAMKCLTAGLLLGTSQAGGERKRFPDTKAGAAAAAMAEVFLGISR